MYTYTYKHNTLCLTAYAVVLSWHTFGTTLLHPRMAPQWGTTFLFKVRTSSRSRVQRKKAWIFSRHCLLLLFRRIKPGTPCSLQRSRSAGVQWNFTGHRSSGAAYRHSGPQCENLLFRWSDYLRLHSIVLMHGININLRTSVIGLCPLLP